MINKDQITKLKLLCEKGCTEGTLEDFCETNDINLKEATHLIHSWLIPDCCKDCRHADNYPNIHPCPSCSRDKTDMYKRSDD